MAATIDGTKGYGFDAYVDALVKAGFEAAMARIKEIPQPLTKIQLTGEPECIQLNTLVLEGEGDSVELEIAPPKTRIPEQSDDANEGPVLRQFAKRHGLDLDDDEAPSWGDMYKLPWCVLLHEQITGVQALAEMLTKAGIEIAEDCECGVGDHDNFWEPSEGFDEMAHEEIAALPEDQQADFAAVCYESKAKQQWLLNG